MIIKKAYKFRAYPNVKQSILLAKSFGACRFLWNQLVEKFNKNDKTIKTTTDYRKEFIWMQEVSAAILQQKERDFFQFKQQFFNKKRKSKVGKPQFKNKFQDQSCRFPTYKFSIDEEISKIRLEKIGRIKVVLDRKLPKDCKMISATVSKNTAGEYYISICVEEEHTPLQKTRREVGLDVGLKVFSALSDGIVICNPHYFIKSQEKLAKLQRHASKKVKGSRRRRELNKKIAKLHRKIANQRSWFLHNLSTWLIKNYDLIAIEDLNIEGMKKNHCLAKAISDVGWAEFFRQLKYKAGWNDKQILTVSRWFASSKTCSGCGHVNKDLKLSDREYHCSECGLIVDRDYNASINILNKAVGVDTAQQTVRDTDRSLEVVHSLCDLSCSKLSIT